MERECGTHVEYVFDYFRKLGRHQVTSVFVLRDDTAFVLASLVEDNLLERMQQAVLYAIHASRSCVEPRDFQATAKLPSWGDYRAFSIPFSRTDTEYCQVLGNVYLRRLAYRAGITKMDNHMYVEVLETMRDMSFQLAQAACVELVSQPRPINDSKKTTLDQGQTERDIAPYPNLLEGLVEGR